ncbi:MAG: AEC family transporter [Clostridia bacterium]|nr:AEC family transporter [Clostridia bacterium]
MDVALKVIYNVALLFIMMIPGILLKKCHLSTDGIGKGISNLVLYIAQPALIFLAYLRPFDREILINSAYVLVLSVVVHVIFSVVAMNCYRKSPDGARRMLRFATIFSNAAFMGIPLISAVLEDSYPGATVYASIYNITFNLFLWSLGVYICTDKRDVNENGVEDDEEHIKQGASPLKALYHPVTIAAAIGLVFFILPIEIYVPGLLTESFTMLKNLVAPLSMVVIGLRLADMDFKGIFKDKDMYIFLLLRHILLPLASLGVIKLVGLLIDIPTVVEMVVVIMASAPAATSATMFAEKYDCDANYVSRLVTVSTLISIVTMPLILLLV